MSKIIQNKLRQLPQGQT